MGMHEFEDIVEMSIRCLDKSNRADDRDLRSVFYTLYKFQANWDTGITYFRVIELLIKYRYVYVFELKQHPDYETYKDYFDSLKGFEEICRTPDQEWDSENNPSVGFYCDPVEEWGKAHADKRNWGELAKPHLYCTAGSELWQRFVNNGMLAGKDAEIPNEADIFETAAMLCEEAEKQDDIRLINWWYAILPSEFGFYETDKFEELKLNSHILKVMEIAERTKAYTENYEYGMLKLPSPEILENNFHDWDFDAANPEDMTKIKFLAWWYEPLKKYYDVRENYWEHWNSEASRHIESAQSIKRCLDPEVRHNPESLKNLAEKLATVYSDAYIAAEKGLSIDSRQDALWINKGIVCSETDRADEAIECYSTAIGLQPQNDKAYAYRGKEYAKKGSNDLARADFEKALKINPENEFASYYLKGMKG